MQKGYLIGETPAGETVLIESGDPREMRRLFKQSDGAGFVSLQVVESSVGRTRNKRFPKNAIQSTPTPTPDADADADADAEDDADADADEIDELEIEALRELAAGDKRKAEVKEAIARLAEIGIDS